MTSLSQRLGGRLPSPPLPAIELSPASTRQARHHVEERFSGIPEHAPAALDLEVTRGVIERALANRAPLAGIGRRHLRLAPWVMLATADGRPPLVERADFLQAYRDYLQTTTDGPVIVNLVLALLSHYPTHLPSFSALLTLAASLLERCSRPRCRRLQRCAARHSLLAPEGHRRFWNHLARATTPIDEFLRESCLGGILSTGRFVEGTLRTALADTMRQLRAGELEPAQLERALAFALDGAGKRLRFAGATRITVADALLLPFREANHANPHQPRIQEFLLEQFSDPRINRAPWHGVNEEAVAVMRRWMVSETLEDFFRLLEYTSQEDPTARRHWHYRKAFWSAYLRAGVINDAWVALAYNVDAAAQRQMGASRDSYGRLDGYNVQRNHAALLLRIGHLVIADWSHNGKFRVWHLAGAFREFAPTLYQKRYTGEALRRVADFEGAHSGAENGSWQQKLAKYIRDNTGVRFDLWQLMPR